MFAGAHENPESHLFWTPFYIIRRISSVCTGKYSCALTSHVFVSICNHNSCNQNAALDYTRNFYVATKCACACKFGRIYHTHNSPLDYYYVFRHFDDAVCKHVVPVQILEKPGFFGPEVRGNFPENHRVLHQRPIMLNIDLKKFKLTIRHHFRILRRIKMKMQSQTFREISNKNASIYK